MKEEYPVFCKWYGVLDQTFSVVERFPRWVRPTMGDHILGLSIEVIGHIVEAIYRPEQRLGKLEQINLELEKLRVLWRLCLERKWLSFAQYEQLESAIEESGKMVGGWLKQCR